MPAVEEEEPDAELQVEVVDAVEGEDEPIHPDEIELPSQESSSSAGALHDQPENLEEHYDHNADDLAESYQVVDFEPLQEDDDQ